MNLAPTEEQRAIIDALHDFAEQEIRPLSRESEAQGQVSERIEKQLVEMGVAAPVPEEFGGQGTFDAMTSVLIAEEIAWGDPGTAYGVLAAGVAATIIETAASPEQKRSLLPRLLNGERGSVALAERDAGAEPSALETSADGGKLSGTKYAVVNADAGIRVVVARGPSLWVLPDDADFELKQEDKLGLRSARTFKVRFEGVAAEAIGDPSSVQTAVLRARLINGGIALGLARAALEYASKYAQERTAFGRPIGAFQGISFKIADRAMDLESARLLIWESACAVDAGRDDAGLLVASACGHAVAAAAACADDGVQILGGHGYMQDHPEEMWYRDALTLATFDSPSMVGDLLLSQTYKEPPG